MDGQRTVDDSASALISICITKKEKTKLNTGERERERERKQDAMVDQRLTYVSIKVCRCLTQRRRRGRDSRGGEETDCWLLRATNDGNDDEMTVRVRKGVSVRVRVSQLSLSLNSQGSLSISKKSNEWCADRTDRRLVTQTLVLTQNDVVLQYTKRRRFIYRSVRFTWVIDRANRTAKNRST